MMDVASDSSQGVCEYAACDLPATAEADGWDFCSRHLAEHHLIMAGEELPDLPRKLLPIPCGSEAGEAAHRRRGQAPCSECKEAKRQADYRRNATYTARWHRRKDVA